MAVKLANAGSVMPAYHDIDNQPGHSDHFLLTTVLREQWGFDGIVVADYGGVSLLHQHHGVSHDATESAALAFNAGLDVELPKDDCARHLAEAVERGLISMAKVDEIVGRVLTENSVSACLKTRMPMKAALICKMRPPGRLHVRWRPVR